MSAATLLRRLGSRRLATASVQPPLAGFRVLELASVLAGPSVGQFLAELGADVVKVENCRTRGDVTRGWKLPGDKPDGPTAYFSSCNLGKRSIALDASKPRGQAICRQLAAKSDVVVASYKPGDAEKLGLDAKVLRSENPRLIYAQITGYGLDDPRVGYDALIQAEAGFTFMNGEPGPDRLPTKMPVALVDLLCAHQLKEAILLALWQRDRTGGGSHVHASLMGAAVASLANQATGYLCAGAVPQRMGSDHPSICPYGTTFYDRDGQPLVLAVGADAQFRALCEILGCAEMGTDPNYAKNADRVARRAELTAVLADRIKTWARADLLSRLNERKVPAGAIADMPTVFGSPQAQALVVRAAEPAAEAGQGRALGLRQVAWRGGHAEELPAPRGPPLYGQHTAEVLGDLGIPEAELKELVAEGVVQVQAAPP
uniref:Formyl-CoA transferase n=1 Tax=Alexandrium catenella TaxID=2925 RepID=A0A7S1VZ21_ALECA